MRCTVWLAVLFLRNDLSTGDDLPDICTQTVYDPNINDMSGLISCC